ncbi:MAG: CRISPR-associated helicase Cas3', partial [Oscillospiraceae bacterium]
MEYCAHIRPNDQKIQSVKEHCLAVSELSKHYAEKLGLSAIAEIQGVIHDFGKLNFDFNEYINGSEKYSRGSIDHSFAGAKYICELSDRLDKKKLYSASRLIAKTVISHHGLNDWLDDEGEDCFSKRISKTERYDEIKSVIPEIIQENDLEEMLYKAAAELDEAKKKLVALSGPDKTQYAFYHGMLERLMQSILIDADRTDTADFMSNCKTGKSFDTETLWKNMQKNMSAKLSEFSDRTDKISLQRKSISDRCAEFAKHKIGICTMTVPTGGGKTLSSLRFAADYCNNFGMEKIFYIAPFMSILEQNSDEIRKIAGDENFLEHHSDAIAELDDDNELAEYELRSEKWDAPVIATTMVQFLNTLFSGKNTSIRRMHQLCRSVIIIDEVQSIPLKCVNMFSLAMNFLAHVCGCTVIFSSATQPCFDSKEYKVLFDENSSMTGDFKEDFEIFRRTEIIPETAKSYTYKEAAEFCHEKFKERNDLLLVVNTKAAALEIYKAISEINSTDEKKAEIIHLSTNMCPEHRREKIKTIRTLLEKEKPVICVTTQLIEAGVDISFNCVVRSLAGMDNIAQAAGRCNRNGKSDELCPVYVIDINGEKLGSLKEIAAAQTYSRSILGNAGCTDYLSDETIKIYFRKVYSSCASKLSYTENVSAADESLLNLLSVNKNRYAVRKNKECGWHCSQAFKIAGKIFNVIDNNT